MLIQSEFVDLNTPTGVMRTYVHKPVTHKKTPAILFYSEIFQQTGPIERAAKIIAGHGFTVLVPEVFHELNPIGTVLAMTMQVVIKVMQISQLKMWKVMTQTIKR